MSKVSQRDDPRMRRFRARCIETIGIHIAVRLVGMFAWFCQRQGSLRFENVGRFEDTVWLGNCLIVANHPTMLETLFIPVAAYPALLREHRLLPWSVSDRKVLPWPLRWLFPLLRIVTIDRNDTSYTAGGIRRSIALLKGGGAIVVYPEGGRTGKGTTFVTSKERRMRSIAPTVCAVARKTEATILPVWVEFEGVTSALGLLGAIRWLLSGHRMTIYFGESYRIGEGSLEDVRQELMQRVLHAGAVGTRMSRPRFFCAVYST